MSDPTLSAVRTLDYEPLGHFKATYFVTATNGEQLPPVMLGIKHGGHQWIDFLTSAEAGILGRALINMAERVRGES